VAAREDADLHALPSEGLREVAHIDAHAASFAFAKACQWA
jgi:hypothetical protein